MNVGSHLHLKILNKKTTIIVKKNLGTISFERLTKFEMTLKLIFMPTALR